MQTEKSQVEKICHCLVRAMIPHVRYNRFSPAEMAMEALAVSETNTRDALRLLLDNGFFIDAGLDDFVKEAIAEFEGIE